MSKKVIILVEDHYNDFELWIPYYRLKEAGAEVVTAGPEAGGGHMGKYGIPCVADTDYKQALAMNPSGVVVPGGYAPDMIRRHDAAIELTRAVCEAGKMTAFICHAGWVLISAGVLRGRKATSFFAIKDDMVNAGVEWVDEPVVVDGNLISSRQPDDLPMFCKEMVKMLGLE